ncbi:MAG: hypothetical protein U5N58_02200 [Actinomycetota bacterium]|nr:hypothetical protein [Actinomycetota bacterium]
MTWRDGLTIYRWARIMFMPPAARVFQPIAWGRNPDCRKPLTWEAICRRLWWAGNIYGVCCKPDKSSQLVAVDRQGLDVSSGSRWKGWPGVSTGTSKPYLW